MKYGKEFWSEEKKEKIHKKTKSHAKDDLVKHHSSKKPMAGKTQKSSKVKSFMKERMHDFKNKAMHSRTKKGPVVTNPKQAIAIGLSELRSKGAKIPKKSKSK